MAETIKIASTVTTDRLDKAYILINSIRQNRLPDTEVDFYLFVAYQNDMHEIDCFYYFRDLMDPSFRIWFKDADQFKHQVNAPHSYIYYVRYLFPKFFTELDKIIYVDASDVACIHPGIEDMWHLDIDGYWLGAVLDPTWQYCGGYQFELRNTGTDHYFNDGIILMNLKQLREDGMDEELADWCIDWDESKLRRVCFAQTLANYLLQDKVKLINSRYNNSLLAALGVAKDAYTMQLNSEYWLNPLDSIDHAVFVHFCGSKKPWDPAALACSYEEYPYKDEAVDLWKQIVQRYGKPA